MIGAAGIDWQFLVVTGAAVWGAWFLLRPLRRVRGAEPRGGCGHCSSLGCMKPEGGKPKAAGLVRLSGASRLRKSFQGPPPGSGA